MLAEFRSKSIIREEWTLRIPVEVSDVMAAINVAATSRANAALSPTVSNLTDVRVTVEDDDVLIIGYSYEEDRKSVV